MATVPAPIDARLWSSAGPMPEDMTPSEVRLSSQIRMMRDEMRIAHDRQRDATVVCARLLLFNGALLVAMFVLLVAMFVLWVFA